MRHSDFVSPYLMRPLRTLEEARADIAKKYEGLTKKALDTGGKAH